jgi:hypothetical protein
MEPTHKKEELCTKKFITKDSRTKNQRAYIEKLKQKSLIKQMEEQAKPACILKELQRIEQVLDRLPNHLRPIIEEDFPKEIVEY